MKTRTLVWILVTLAVIGAGWYWWSWQHESISAPAQSESATSTNASQDQQPASAASIIGANLALGTDKSKTLGTYLIGYNGMTLYTYAKDTSAASTCYDACAQNWPPYIVSSSDNIEQLEAGVTGQVGTIIRTDGSLQLTYNGHPLYFYAGDKTGDDANGEGIGGVWYVVKP